MKKVKLGDVIDYFISGDWGKEQNSNQTPNKVSCVRGADIDNVNAKQSETIPIRYVKNSSFENKILAIGDIIIEKSGGSPTQSTGRVAFISEKIKNELNHIVCSNFCTAFRVKHEYDALFVYYFFQHIYKSDVFFQFESQTTGIKNLLLDLALTEIPFVDFEKTTQSAIARVLSSFDDKIELNNKINKELENLARTIYEYWFVQNADEKWERKKIEELIQKYTDKSLRIDAKNILKEGKHPVITQDVGDLVKGYTNEENPISDLPAIIFGDHSCTLRYINFPFFRGADGTQLLYFENKETTIYAYFCLNKLIPNLPNFGKYERHFKYLKVFEISIPPHAILEKFNKTVSPIFEQIIKNRQENAELSRLRDFLLPLLMNGQVKAESLNITQPEDSVSGLGSNSNNIALKGQLKKGG